MFEARHTGSLGELRVQFQYLDREGDFVADALSVRLVTTPQFKIFKAVIQSVPVFVMNRFVLCKWTIQKFFHQNPMLKFFDSATKVKAAISTRMDMPFFGNWSPFSSFPTAFFGAKFLPHVVTCMSTVFGFAKPSFFGFAAQLALKSRRRFLAHEHWLAHAMNLSSLRA